MHNPYTPIELEAPIRAKFRCFKSAVPSGKLLPVTNPPLDFQPSRNKEVFIGIAFLDGERFLYRLKWGPTYHYTLTAAISFAIDQFIRDTHTTQSLKHCDKHKPAPESVDRLTLVDMRRPLHRNVFYEIYTAKVEDLPKQKKQDMLQVFHTAQAQLDNTTHQMKLCCTLL